MVEVGWVGSGVVVEVDVVGAGLVGFDSLFVWRTLDVALVLEMSAIAPLNVKPRAMMRKAFRATCMMVSWGLGLCLKLVLRTMSCSQYAMGSKRPPPRLGFSK